jgi:hypothetical protein
VSPFDKSSGEPPFEKTSGEFSVCVVYPDDYWEYVRRFVGAEAAVMAAKRYSESVGARLGFIQRIIITDGEDYTVFEWLREQGVIFPPRQAPT